MIDLIIYGIPVVVVAYLLGWGLAALLLPPQLRGLEPVFAPWIGMVQAALVLIPFGCFGIGVRRVWPAAVLVAAVALAAAARQHRLRAHWSRVILPVTLVCVIISLVLAPMFTRWGGLNTFTLGNNDPFTYVLTASWANEHGLLPLPVGSLWHATADNRIASADPRWLPVVYLALFSSILHVDGARLFSLIETLVFALQFPLVVVLGQRVFGLAGIWLLTGFLMTLLNPYPAYVAFHGFMPQVFATGFFLSFVIVLAAFLENQRISPLDGLLVVLFGAGLFMSYPELVPFAAFVLGAYAVTTAVRQGRWLARLGAALLVATGVVTLSPFQVAEIFRIVRSHFAAIAGDSSARVGWPMEGSYIKLGGMLNVDPFGLRVAMFAALVVLTVLGVIALRTRRPLVLLVAAPFVAAGAVAYHADYSYAFFKNWTYVYFWLPLVIGQGIGTAVRWCRLARLRSVARSTLVGSLILLTIVVVGSEARATNRLRMRFAARGQSVPLELAKLEPLNKDSAINDIFVAGLDFWESVWAVYYLRDKHIGMASVNGYVANDAGLSDEGRWHFLLSREEFRPLIGSMGRRVEVMMVRTPHFSFGRLEHVTEEQLGSLELGRGFERVRRNSQGEWTSFDRNAELIIRWRGQPSSRLLSIEYETALAQTLHVSADDRIIDSLALQAGLRGIHHVCLPVAVGDNHIGLGIVPDASHVDTSADVVVVRVFSFGLRKLCDDTVPPCRRQCVGRMEAERIERF